MEGLRLKRSTRDWTGESRKLINAKLPKGKRVTAEGEQKMSLLSARSNVVASNLSQASHNAEGVQVWWWQSDVQILNSRCVVLLSPKSHVMNDISH